MFSLLFYSTSDACSPHSVILRLNSSLPWFENLTKPPFIFGNENYTSEAAIGLLFGLSCAILVGLVTNTLRKIGKNVHFTINSLYYSITGMIVLGSTIMLTTGFSMPCQVTREEYVVDTDCPDQPFEYKLYYFSRTIFGCYFTSDLMVYWRRAVWYWHVKEKRPAE